MEGFGDHWLGSSSDCSSGSAGVGSGPETSSLSFRSHRHLRNGKLYFSLCSNTFKRSFFTKLHRKMTS